MNAFDGWEKPMRPGVEPVKLHPEDSLRLLAHGIDPESLTTHAEVLAALDALPRECGS